MNPVEILERALDEWKRGVTSEACLVEGIQQVLAALRGPEPDWSEAPEWAEWWAVFAEGRAFWYSHKPRPANALWSRTTMANLRDTRILDAGHVTLSLGTDWRLTLRKRPEASE